MARARLLKPSFFSNETLAEIPPHGRLLFQGLWVIADREGRLEDRPKRIKAEVFPYESVNVEVLLKKLADGGFITRYQGEDGVAYIAIPSFLRHQTPHHREAPSRIPAPAQPRARSRHEPRASTDLGEAEPGTSLPVPVAVAVTGDPVTSNQLPVTGDPVAVAVADPVEAAAGAEPDGMSETTMLLRHWERCTGAVAPPLIADSIDAMLGERVPADWIRDAMTETGNATSKSWKYTSSIIARWRHDGRTDTRDKANGNGAPGSSFEETKARYGNPWAKLGIES